MCPGVRGSRVDPRWRSGRSPATPDRLCKRECTPQRPTLQHKSHLSSHHGGIESGRGPVFPANVRVSRWVGGAVAAAQRPQDGVQTARVHVELQFAGLARSLRRRPRTRLLALPSLLLAVALGACGGAGGASDADPATAVPAGVAMYFDGVVRPEGDQREDVLDAACFVHGTETTE